MADMGMSGMDHGSSGDAGMSGMDHGSGGDMAGMDHGSSGQSEMAGMAGMSGMQMRDTSLLPPDVKVGPGLDMVSRSEEHTSELQSLMRISYAVFCLKKKKTNR